MPEIKPALLLPGMGAQYQGMGEALFEKSAEARAILELASDISHQSVANIIRNNPENVLQRKPSIIALTTATISLATYSYLREEGMPDPVIVSPFSAGKPQAGVIAGFYDSATGIDLAYKRGLAMEAAVEHAEKKNEPVGVGVLFGMNQTDLDLLLLEMGVDVSTIRTTVVNFKQLVIGGMRSQVDSVLERIGDKRKAISYHDKAPLSHHPLMVDAQQNFNTFLESIKEKMQSIQRPILLDDLTNQFLSSASEFIQSQKEHLLNPINYAENIRIMSEKIKNGEINAVIELGAGRVLSNVLNRAKVGIEAQSTDNWAEIQSVKTIWQKK